MQQTLLFLSTVICTVQRKLRLIVRTEIFRGTIKNLPSSDAELFKDFVREFVNSIAVKWL